MDTKTFLFNSSAKYRAGGPFKWKPDLSLTDQQVTSKPCSKMSLPTIKTHRSLETLKWLGIYGKALPLTGGSASLISLSGAPLSGVVFDSEYHLQAKDPILASLYWFHIYYTTRRITLPGDKSHSWHQDDYDARAYKRLCSEFAVSPATDWRQKLNHGCQGLGSWSTQMKPSHEYRHAHQAQHIPPPNGRNQA